MPSFILFRLITLCIFSPVFVFFPVFISCASPPSVVIYFVLWFPIRSFTSTWTTVLVLPPCRSPSWILPLYMYWSASSWIPLFLSLPSQSFHSPFENRIRPLRSPSLSQSWSLTHPSPDHSHRPPSLPLMEVSWGSELCQLLKACLSLHKLWLDWG